MDAARLRAGQTDGWTNKAIEHEGRQPGVRRALPDAQVRSTKRPEGLKKRQLF